MSDARVRVKMIAVDDMRDPLHPLVVRPISASHVNEMVTPRGGHYSSEALPAIILQCHFYTTTRYECMEVCR